MSICLTTENIRRALLDFMEKRGLSIVKLAKLLQLPLSSVQNYCNSKVNPRVDTMELISKATGISIVEFVFSGLSSDELAKNAVHFAKLISRLPPEERRKVVRAFCEAVYLDTGHTPS